MLHQPFMEVWTYGLVGLDLNGAVLWNADGGSNGIDWAGGLAGEGDSIYIAVNFLGLSMTYTDFG